MKSNTIPIGADMGHIKPTNNDQRGERSKGLSLISTVTAVVNIR